MNINIMVVSHRHFAGEDIAETLREYIDSHAIKGVNVRFHVVYRVPYALSMVGNMDIIIGNMRIKGVDKQGIASDIYDSVRELAHVHGIHHFRTMTAKHMPHKVLRTIEKIVEQKSGVSTKDPA